MTNSVIKNKIIIFLTAVVLIAGFFRFYNLDQVPASLYWDEVSIGYNAHSIAETGKDEYGESFPLLFRAFEDYKTPGNIYLTALSVKVFGLNETSVRLPSALLGTLIVLLTYLLVVELLKNRKTFGFDSRYIALLTSFLVALSPWHIQLSRVNFEANTGLFFVVLGAYLFFRFVNIKKYILLLLSVSVFAISIYFYRSMWVFVPLLLIGLYFIHFKFLFSKVYLKNTILSIILFMLIILPFIPQMISSNGSERAGQVGITNNIQDQLNEAWIKKDSSGISGKIIYNRRVVYLSEIGRGYVSHYLPKFLFLDGDPNPRHGVGSVGVLYFWAVLFIIPGLFAVFKLDRKISFSILLWLILAPIPAALAYPTPHALRSINMIPIIQFVIALGAVWLFSFISEKYRKAASAIAIGVFLYFSVSYFGVYYGEYVEKSSPEWADGYKELTSYVFENEKDYEKILITGHFWQPHVYFLFYKNYDPLTYQETGSKKGFDKYIFGGTSWDMEGKELGDQDLGKIAGTNNYIVALSLVEFELQKEKLSIIKEVRNKNNDLVFIIAEPK